MLGFFRPTGRAGRKHGNDWNRRRRWRNYEAERGRLALIAFFLFLLCSFLLAVGLGGTRTQPGFPGTSNGTRTKSGDRLEDGRQYNHGGSRHETTAHTITKEERL